MPPTEKLPVHKSEYSAFLQNEYAMLRVEFDPAQACRALGERYGMRAEVVRRYIGMKSAVRICRVCWMEYVHDFQASVHRCRACEKDVDVLQREAARGVPTGFRTSKDSRYFSDGKRLERTVAFLIHEYRVSRRDAIRMISEVQEGERLTVKNAPDYSSDDWM